MFSQLRNRLKATLSHFQSRVDGNVAVLFGLSSVALFVGVAGAVELSRAYNASQKLNQTADLACQYASRPSQVQLATSAPSTYSANVNSFITTSLKSQRFTYTQSNATPFTYTKNGAADVSLASTVPTVFAGVVHVTTIPISATAHCYDSPSNIPQRVPNNNSNLVTQEGFENTSICPNNYCFVSANGTVGANGGRSGTTSTPSSSPSTTTSYTGATGAVWYVTGYCVEIDHSGVIRTTVPEGNFSAELDCDNGSGNAGNSSISTKVYMPAGSYELRYNYVSRVDYPNYDPTYICGSSASDVIWANDTNSSGGPVANASRTNQINAYLDADTTGSAPTHLTIDQSEHLAGSNLIDVCVYSQNWIERSVRINVTTAGYYWLSFAADGQNDSYGGQIDDIRLCNGTCQDSFQDSFPSSWVSTPLLFEDTFDSPTYSPSNNYNTSGNMYKSYGTSGASNNGWPSKAASGWWTASVNQMAYIFASGSVTASPQGGQGIMLDAVSPSPTNRVLSRPFLLDPGYYRVDYYYVSNWILTPTPPTYCQSAPSAAAAATANPSGTSTSATVRFYSSVTRSNSVLNNSNALGVFMSHSQLASTPYYPSNGGASGGETTYFNNTDGTTNTTPNVPQGGVNLSSYNTSQVNPLLDVCSYSPGWQLRTAFIQIVKPGNYWLTFAALGGADQVGAGIDDVKLTAVGSSYAGSNPVTTIPVPDPQPGATTAFTGFSIIADPLVTPAT